MSEQQSSADSEHPVAWRYTCQDGSQVLMLKPLTSEQKRRGYYIGEDGEDEVGGDDAIIGPFHWAQETPLYAAPQPARTEPQTAPIGYVSQATLRLLSERGQAGNICPVPAYDTLIPVYAGPVQRCQAVSVPTPPEDGLQILEGNCWDLRCIDIPTGGGDADIGWNIVEHHMGPPKERIVGRGRSPREALQDATSTLSRPQRSTPEKEA